MKYLIVVFGALIIGATSLAKTITCDQDDQETIVIGDKGIQIYQIDENYNTEEEPSVVIDKKFDCQFGEAPNPEVFYCHSGGDYVYALKTTETRLSKNGRLDYQQNLEIHTNIKLIAESVAWPAEESDASIIIEDYALPDGKKGGAARCEVTNEYRGVFR